MHRLYHRRRFHSQTVICSAASRGFGSSPAKSSSKKKKNQNDPGSSTSQKSKKKRKTSGLLDEVAKSKNNEGSPAPFSTSGGSNDTVELDRWGLPKTPTLEDVFPPLPIGTELSPVLGPDHDTALKDIEHCLKDHIDLQLSSFFDDNGVEMRNDDTTNDRPKMKLRLLHRSPPVLSIDHFLTDDECDMIRSVAEDPSKQQEVHQVDSATFQGAISTRTSTSWFCRYQALPTFLAKANHVLNLPLECMEEPQIVRYSPGQEFSYHYDEVPPAQLENGGQRLATLLVYLNTVPHEAGGGTTFRDLMTSTAVVATDDDKTGQTDVGEQLVMQPTKGRALIFFPAFKDGRPDDRTLHKSHVMSGWNNDMNDDETASASTKWIVQMWTHERRYNAVLPPTNSNEAARIEMEEAKERLGYLR